MKRGPKKVLLNEKLADWSAAYLAMWKALESFNPNADRWAEPYDAGSREDRITRAQNAVSRVQQRYGGALSQEAEEDIRAFQKHLDSLARGTPYGPGTAQFSRHLGETGSSLADQSVTAAGIASV